MNQLPNNFLELSLKEQEALLTKRFIQINKEQEKLFQLLSIVRGGEKIDAEYLTGKVKKK